MRVFSETVHPFDSTIKRVLYAFVFAFVGSLISTLTGVGSVPDLQTGRALAVSAIIAAIAAGFSAAKNVIFPQGHPAR